MMPAFREAMTDRFILQIAKWRAAAKLIQIQYGNSNTAAAGKTLRNRVRPPCFLMSSDFILHCQGIDYFARSNIQPCGGSSATNCFCLPRFLRFHRSRTCGSEGNPKFRQSKSSFAG